MNRNKIVITIIVSILLFIVIRSVTLSHNCLVGFDKQYNLLALEARHPGITDTMVQKCVNINFLNFSK